MTSALVGSFIPQSKPSLLQANTPEPWYYSNRLYGHKTPSSAVTASPAKPVLVTVSSDFCSDSQIMTFPFLISTLFCWEVLRKCGIAEKEWRKKKKSSGNSSEERTAASECHSNEIPADREWNSWHQPICRYFDDQLSPLPAHLWIVRHQIKIGGLKHLANVPKLKPAGLMKVGLVS